MSQDALERLRNRAKPTVENRDLSSIPLTNNSQDTEHNESSSKDRISVDISKSRYQDSNLSIITDINTQTSSETLLQANDDSSEPFINNSDSNNSKKDKILSNPTEFKTKQSTIRLEKKLSQRLIQKCQEEEITREVFLEALFVYFETHKSAQSKVLQEARKRDEQRQKIANHRRAKSMIERFGNI